MTSAAGQMGITPIRVALVYDFDGTLAPRNLPEHSFLPSVGVTDVEGFWEACRREAERHDSDQVLTYMRMLLTAAERAGTAVTRDLLRRHGAQTPLFAGVEAWFDDIGGYGRSVGVEIEHFVVSSGLLEMIEGLSIHPRFRKVFASSYAYDATGRAVWPASAINYTTKTQYLFRINKGMLEPHEDVNDHMDPDLRPIPFQNMIYIGDGPTDVPCFTLMKRYGGHAIAVYNSDETNRSSFRKCYQLSALADRVKHIAPADYRAGSHLRLLLEEMVLDIADGIVRRKKLEIEEGTVSAPHF